MKRWFYLEDGKEKGPVHDSEVIALIAAARPGPRYQAADHGAWYSSCDATAIAASGLR